MKTDRQKSSRTVRSRLGAAICALLALGAVCPGEATAQTTPAPSITSLSPSSATAGGPAFVLTVTGANFAAGATVSWSGSPLSTTFVGSTQLNANVPASLIAQPGLAVVTVSNPGGSQSNPMPFLIQQTPIVITTDSLPAGRVGEAYAFTLAATGGAPPYVWSSLTALPPGLFLTPYGTIQGTPTATGNFNLTLRVTDARQGTATVSLPLLVNPPALSITTSTPLPAAVVGQPYSQTLAATGGTPPYRWAASTGLPLGLTLDPATGVLAGTPSLTGSFSLSIQVVDNAGVAATKTFALTVNPPPLAITTVPPLFNGTVGQPYSLTFSASGGVPPYGWSIISGQTGGLTLDPSTGALQGTPQTAGTFTFTIQVADNVRTTASQTFSILITSPTLTITTGSSLPAGTVGVSYASIAFAVVGGTQPYTWLLTAGSVPGLTFSSTGVLAGTPVSAGTFAFTVQAKDNTGLTATKSFTLIVNPGALKLTSATQLPAAAVGIPYSHTMTATGGVPPYTWSANGLPDGLTIDAPTGLIYGAPAVPGSFQLTVTVRDRTLTSAVGPFRITVNLPAPPSLTIAGPPATVQPADQSGNLRVSLESPYPGPVSGTLSLSFAPDVGAGDATIRFSNGGLSADFDIPVGSTVATFRDPNLAIQTGTVAGTIIFSVTQLQAFGVTITPASTPTLSVRIERAAPSITNARIIRNANGFDIEITGFCTSREVTQATFRFTATPGKTLQTPEINIAIDALFSKWFQDPASSRFGSQFTFTQSFTVQGDASAVTPDSVTLTNRLGSVSAKVTP